MNTLLPYPTNLALYFRYVQEILEGVTDIDLVINLKLREEALLAKCLGRRICSECGGNYNIACIDIKGDDGSPELYMAPLLPPPHCEAKLIMRSDDTEEVVKKRLRVYNEMVTLHLLRMSFANLLVILSFCMQFRNKWSELFLMFFFLCCLLVSYVDFLVQW